MKLLFAPDSYKGTLSAVRITELLEEAAKEVFSDPEIVKIPVADGGEGTVDALALSLAAERFTVQVKGPRGKTVEAVYAMSEECAIIEMAAASGLPLLEPSERDPLETSSYGTGELILAAIERGAKRILIGIGGSATNDGGMGMLAALGVAFFDEQGNLLFGCGKNLRKVEKIDSMGLSPKLKDVAITVICDVKNPLLGAEGATAVYGPQKGADEARLQELEAGMIHYAAKWEENGRDIADFAGAGAAGGMGGALAGVLGGTLRSGIDAVLDAVNFEEKLSGVELVITGEGRIDGQSVRFGKVPAGVALRAERRGVPTVAIVGGMGRGAEDFLALGNTSIMPTIPDAMPLSEALAHAEESFKSAALRTFRMIKIGRDTVQKR